MKIDKEKLDDVALVLLSMTLDENNHAWKQLDWSITNRLYDKGYIHDPVNKKKSVVFTEVGAAKAVKVFEQLFSKN